MWVTSNQTNFSILVDAFVFVALVWIRPLNVPPCFSRYFIIGNQQPLQKYSTFRQGLWEVILDKVVEKHYVLVS